jgi:XTP/dITP diphosphohydrolase
MDLVIASKNLHKIREFREMLKPFKHVDVLSLLNFPHYEPEGEEGSTFKEIAQYKALNAARALNKIVLADDSGLIVPALGGAPGILSRRYAGEEATDAENRQKLLKALKNQQEHVRGAYFECCLVLASPEKILKSVSGICEGTIAIEERGRNGFGYDSVFIKSEYDKTFAEIEEKTRNKISHRRKAFEKLINTLETML